jgi:hypothetical protein
MYLALQTWIASGAKQLDFGDVLLSPVTSKSFAASSFHAPLKWSISWPLGRSSQSLPSKPYSCTDILSFPELTDIWEHAILLFEIEKSRNRSRCSLTSTQFRNPSPSTNPVRISRYSRRTLGSFIGTWVNSVSHHSFS